VVREILFPYSDNLSKVINALRGQTRRVLVLKNLLHALTIAGYWIKSKLTQRTTLPNKKVTVKVANCQWLNASILQENTEKYPANFPIYVCKSMYNKSRTNKWIFHVKRKAFVDFIEIRRGFRFYQNRPTAMDTTHEDIHMCVPVRSFSVDG